MNARVVLTSFMNGFCFEKDAFRDCYNGCCNRVDCVGQLLSSLFAPAVKAKPVQDDLVAAMISRISESEIYKTAYALQNFTTRRYGYLGNEDAATRLYSRLSNIPGLSVEYQDQYNNVIATLPGDDTTSNATYMVGAHYDNISSTSYAPGATDNGGGVAIVLELARVMSQYSFNHTLKFAFWNLEEAKQQVSKSYVSYAKANNVNILLYFNYDSSCYDPDNRFVLDIMYNTQSRWISDLMTIYNSLYSIGFNLTYNVHTCTSDHLPFRNNGYRDVLTHAETYGSAHTPNDTVDTLSTVYATKNGQLGMSVLAALASGKESG